MKKILLGFILGALVLFLFLYFGGAKYLKTFGQKTEQAGEKLEGYEKQIKEKTEGAGKAVRETAESAKKAAEKTKEKVEEYVGK